MGIRRPLAQSFAMRLTAGLLPAGRGQFELTLWFGGGFYGLPAACQPIATWSISFCFTVLCGLVEATAPIEPAKDEDQRTAATTCPVRSACVAMAIPAMRLDADPS